MMLDILVVSPHPDDAELGMAGAILKFKAEGLAVGVLDLTSGEPTPRGTPEIRARETAAATEILGLDWRENLDLPNRSLEPTPRSPRPARRRLPPDASPMDLRPLLDRRPSRPRRGHGADRGGPVLVEAHQDRPARSAALPRADLLLLLRAPPPHPQPAFILDISDHWDAKQAAIECYKSQFLEGQPEGFPTIVDRLRDHAASWGWILGTRYGEPFTAREPIGLSSMQHIV